MGVKASNHTTELMNKIGRSNTNRQSEIAHRARIHMQDPETDENHSTRLYK